LTNGQNSPSRLWEADGVDVRPNEMLEQRLAKIEDAVTRLCAAAEQRDAHLVEWLDPAIGAASIDDLERESA
jgi:hypothetical protein